MKNLDYLRKVCENGNKEAAKTAEEMSRCKDYHGFDSFLGLYYELAKMELQSVGEKTEPVREFAIDKALERIDKRLDCADFAIPALIRMLHEHKGTGRLSDEAAEKIQKSLLGFKYWLDEPDAVHACYFTENHQILYHSAEYLVGQLFPRAVFSSNGITGEEHKKHGKEFMLRWLNWRERFGFSEWLTQGYYLEDILGLICLTIYAEDESIRTRAKMLIDMLIYDIAVNSLHGHMPTTHGRVYARFIIEPDYEDCTALMRLCWDEGYIESGMCECAVMLAACGYECPAAIREAAKNEGGVQVNRERMSIDVCDAKKFGIDPADFDNIMFFWGMQTYSDRLCIENSMKVFPTWNWMTNRVMAYREMYRLCDEADAPCADAPDFTAMTEANIITRRTPDYILSCVQDFRRGKMGYQQHPWTASLGGKAVIFTTSPASLEYSNRPNRWAGNLCLPRTAMDENVLICIYRIKPDFVDYLYSHLYFPKHEMDEVIEKDNFIFGRRGDGYIAVRSLLPACWEEKDPEMFRALWEKDWEKRFESAEEYEYIAQGHANVWTIEVGSRAENGSFEAFVKSFEKAELCGDSHNMLYRAGNGKTYKFGWNAPLTVNETEIPLRGYKRYDNASCNAEFDAKRLEISAGGHSLTLDFENVKHVIG